MKHENGKWVREKPHMCLMYFVLVSHAKYEIMIIEQKAYVISLLTKIQPFSNRNEWENKSKKSMWQVNERDRQKLSKTRQTKDAFALIKSDSTKFHTHTHTQRHIMQIVKEIIDYLQWIKSLFLRPSVRPFVKISFSIPLHSSKMIFVSIECLYSVVRCVYFICECMCVIIRLLRGLLLKRPQVGHRQLYFTE